MTIKEHLEYKSQIDVIEKLLKRKYFCIGKIAYIPVSKALNYCLKVKCKSLRYFDKNHKKRRIK